MTLLLLTGPFKKGNKFLSANVALIWKCLQSIEIYPLPLRGMSALSGELTVNMLLPPFGKGSTLQGVELD